MPAPQSFNKILLTTSNTAENNITLQEISGQLYINDHLVITSANIGSLSDITTIESDVTTLQSDVTTLQDDVTTLQNASAFANDYSLSFDGSDDYVAITPTSSITIYGFSAWVYLNSDLDKSTAQGIVCGPSGTDWILALGGNYTSTLTDEIISVNFGARYGYCHSSETVSTGWHHMMIVWSTSSQTNSGSQGYDIYLDGVNVGNQANTDYGAANLYSIPTSTFRLGQRANGAYPFGGNLDEVAIFTSSLSASDVSTIYNSGVPGDISSLNPFGWWRMGDDDGGTGTTVTDQGSGGNNGTLTNGPTFSTNVPQEEESFNNTYSLDLDGANDYLSISASSYSISGNKSFSVWVKPTSGSYHYLWGYGSNLYALYFDSSAVSIRMWPSGQGGGSGRTYQRMVSPVTFSLNSWYNIIITGDGTTLKLYVNGQPAASTYTDNDDWYFETALRAGASGASFSGLVDEFAFFNSTLTSSEVSAIYGSGTPSSLSSYSPHLWWRMGDDDGGTGTTVTDQGSGSNDATLTNGPTFSTTIPS